MPQRAVGRFFCSQHAVLGAIRYLYVVNLNLDIDNRSLVEQCLAGDRTALSLFYTRFAPAMLGIVSRYVPTRADAEDILHDGFVIAFTRLDSVRDYEHVDHWLATIMKNLSLQFLKNQDVSCLLHDTPEVADTPDIEDFIDIETLETLISKLPAGYQRVFRLAVLENKTHKEIADILGIAPNSSSSQLFHAKIMLRRLISDYKRQAGLLVLALMITTGIYLMVHMQPTGQIQSEQDIAANTEALPAIQSTGATHNLLAKTNTAIPCRAVSASAKPAVSMPNHTSSTASPALASDSLSEYAGITMPEDTLRPGHTRMTLTNMDRPKQESTGAIPRHDSTPVPTNVIPSILQADYITPSKVRNKWGIGLSASSGIINTSKTSPYNISDANPDNPGPDNPDENLNDPDNSARREGRHAPHSDFSDMSHHNYVPLSICLGTSCRLSDRLSLESGIVYSYLHTDFSGYDSESHCYWHYIGIPLKLNVTAFSTHGLRLYATVGGEMDIPIYSKSVSTSGSSYLPGLQSGHFDSYVSWSLGAGIGASYRITDNLDIFIEPTLQYRFKNRQEVPNYWTDNRWGISLPFGFRFRLPR